jgi:peptidyl-tRNA hydrolase, PTH1 family
MNRKKLVVGLGNPGPRYAKTPHNLGFEVVDLLAADFGATLKWQDVERSRVAWCSFEGWELILAKPQTYMNLSGEAVESLCQVCSFGVSELIVVCDDLALPVGKIRIRSQGSAGGHNGLKSIIEVLARDDFTRVRLGIAPDVEISEAAEYVLTPIPDRFREDFDQLIVRGKEAVRAICLEGVIAAMNQFN